MKMEIRGPITITKQFRQLQNIFFFFSQNTYSLTKTEIPSFRKFWVKNGSYDNSKWRSHSQIEISLFAWKAMWTESVVWKKRFHRAQRQRKKLLLLYLQLNCHKLKKLKYFSECLHQTVTDVTVSFFFFFCVLSEQFSIKYC